MFMKAFVSMVGRVVVASVVALAVIGGAAYFVVEVGIPALSALLSAAP